MSLMFKTAEVLPAN